MKKMKLLLCFGAMTAVALFSACASSEVDELTPGNEQPSTLGEPVKAQFSVSIPMSAKKSTRMSDDVVQKYANTDITKFRGISDIRLYPTTTPATATDFATSANLGGSIHLTQLLLPTNSAVNQSIPSGTSPLLQNSNAVLYGDVVLDMGTQTFLFYGKATEATSGKFVNGSLTTNVLEGATYASSFYFEPEAILDATYSSQRTSTQKSILAYLNSIVQATDGTTAWKDATSQTLKTLYAEFIKMKAGSSLHLQALIEDLYNALGEDKYPNTWPDYSVAQAIRAAIANTDYAANVSITGDGTEKTLKFTSEFAGYPGKYNLPDGAAVIHFDSSSDEFSYVDQSTELNVADVYKFAYPANLYYWVNSPIKTSNTLQEKNYGDKTWEQIKGLYEDDTKITATTRSVLLTEPVQYGVARFDAEVRAANSGTSPTTLDDNGEKFKSKGVETKKVLLSDIKLTGIIIGGQKKVAWNFIPVTTETQYSIYDDIITSRGLTEGLAIGTSDYTTNSTLVLETAGGKDSENKYADKIHVVLEFVNTGGEFWGKDGIVPTGCKFYLDGELNVDEEFKAAGTDKQTLIQQIDGKLFKQDYVTVAKFTINSLKSATITIPDLRNPAVELGLSVDLEWKKGIDFDIVIE